MMPKLSIINILPNCFADAFDIFKNIASKLQNTAAGTAFTKNRYLFI